MNTAVSTGAQAVVSGVHPSGDRYRWEGGGFDAAKITEVGAEELSEMALDVAIAAAVLRYYPCEGGRRDYVLTLAGFLLRKLPEERVKSIVRAAALEARDEEISSRLRAVVDTAKKLKADKKVTGGPTIRTEYPELFAVLSQDTWLGELENATDDDRTQTEVLLDLVSKEAELFRTPDDEAYATVVVDGHRENYGVRGRQFGHWLTRRYFEERGTAPDSRAFANAKNTVEAMALYKGEEHEVFLRVARGPDGALYLNLANKAWEAVKIAGAGFEVVADPPVKFIRSANMLSLPYPDENVSAEELPDLLSPFVNVADEDDLKLLIGWLLNSMHPEGSYAIGIILGEQGSAKTTVQRIIRSVADPTTDPLRAPPKDPENLSIAAAWNWALSFDNISSIPSDLSDAICRLSTGGAFATRKYYTNGEEVLFSARRPILLNGITNIASRGDLRERSIILELPHIPKARRRREGDVMREFREVHPRILGALLAVVSGVLAREAEVEIEELPRMTEFAVWGTAAEESLGWEAGSFLQAYAKSSRAAIQNALSLDPVAGAVRDLMANRATWEGTPTQLYKDLEGYVSESVQRTPLWPGSPRWLSSALDRLAPQLREFGYEVIRPGRSGNRKIRIHKTGAPPDGGGGSGDATGDANVATRDSVAGSATDKIPANGHKILRWTLTTLKPPLYAHERKKRAGERQRVGCRVGEK